MRKNEKTIGEIIINGSLVPVTMTPLTKAAYRRDVSNFPEDAAMDILTRFPNVTVDRKHQVLNFYSVEFFYRADLIRNPDGSIHGMDIVHFKHIGKKGNIRYQIA